MAERVAAALLVHGAGGGGWEWNLWRGVFVAAGLAVRAPDLQPSPDGWQATAMEDYLAQLRQALAGLPRPRVVVGASLGGLLALQLTDAVDALVLVNPLPPAPWAEALPPRRWPDRVPWGRDASLAGTVAAMPDADPAATLYAVARWRDESGAVLRAAHAGLAVPPPACPCLCVASQDDRDVPAAITEALADAWGAALLRLPGSSHVGPLLGRDAPLVATQVLDWLSRLDIRAPGWPPGAKPSTLPATRLRAAG